METQEAPVIDLQQLGSKELTEFHQDDLLALGKLLMTKAESCGFVGFKNHGLPLDFVNKLHSSTNTFFELPTDEKMKSKRNLETFQGYTDGTVENLDGDHSGAVDCKETFDFVSLEYDFPKKVPEMKQAAASSFRILWPFVQKLFTIIELGMGWETGLLKKIHTEHPNGVTTLRTLKYPPVADTKKNFIRCGAHKDISTFTIQFQSHIGGFQVLHDNQWKNADGNPDIISFLFGECMEILSGDQIQAAAHRVVINDEETQGKKTRLSMAFFVHADKDKDLYSVSGPKKYDPINSHEFLQKQLGAYTKIS